MDGGGDECWLGFGASRDTFAAGGSPPLKAECCGNGVGNPTRANGDTFGILSRAPAGFPFWDVGGLVTPKDTRPAFATGVDLGRPKALGEALKDRRVNGSEKDPGVVPSDDVREGAGEEGAREDCEGVQSSSSSSTRGETRLPSGMLPLPDLARGVACWLEPMVEELMEPLGPGGRD